VYSVLDLDEESPATRARYGPSAVGQSLLMARRLVEAGLPLVTVNWEDETKIDGVNTCWDTHQGNFGKLKNLLCPIFDQVFPAFITDLAERGLLETTLVVAIGEFGRSPQKGVSTSGNGNSPDGRDHWPYCYTALVAGAGIKRGHVHGESDRTASSPRKDPVHPGELLATIYHAFGIDPHTMVENHLKQPRELVQAEPLPQLFG